MKIAEELKKRLQHIDELMAAVNAADTTETFKEWVQLMQNGSPELDAAEANLKTAGEELYAWRTEHDAELDEWRKSCGAYINPQWIGDGMDTCDKWLITINCETVEGYPYTCPAPFDEKKALGLR